MPLYTISEAQMRDGCKRAIEGLELWLRRLIDIKLTEAYGQDYLDAQRADKSRAINSGLAKTLTERRSQEPARFVRPIDAAFLADQIQIICNPTLYRDHFADSLSDVFPRQRSCDEHFSTVSLHLETHYLTQIQFLCTMPIEFSVTRWTW